MSETTEWDYNGDACDDYYPGALVTITGRLRNLMLETSKNIKCENSMESIIRHTFYMSRNGVKSPDGTCSVFQVNFGLNQEHKHQLKIKIGRTGDGMLERVRLMMFDEE
mgnify:CR=1 FL=1